MNEFFFGACIYIQVMIVFVEREMAKMVPTRFHMLLILSREEVVFLMSMNLNRAMPNPPNAP